MLHRFATPIAHIALPEKFTYPFCYTPHPLCIRAAYEVQEYLKEQKQWQQELNAGKMFGVLVVRTPDGELGYLAAFSGILAGKNTHPFFVPPVYDLLKPDGFFKAEEKQISLLNARINALHADSRYIQLKNALARKEQAVTATLNAAKATLTKARLRREERRKNAALTPQGRLTPDEEAAMIRESQFQKAEYKRLEKKLNEQLETLRAPLDEINQHISLLQSERRQRSADLQRYLFAQFQMLNARGERKDLYEIFTKIAHRIPPAGAGECAAPKLLQQAYLNGWQPIAMAEFWWGKSPKAEVRHHGQYYPACLGKCGPILTHMLQGLDVEDNPIEKQCEAMQALSIVYEDEWLAVVDKPAGMLSVPGKVKGISVYSLMRQHYPDAEEPMMVHRLDMATSGLLIVSKVKRVHQALQKQFKEHQVRKRYIALLEGIVRNDRGRIELPLCPDPYDRPRQLVHAIHGKTAITDFEVLNRRDNRTLVAFYPQTGRTHQLRVHAAHPQGLDCPIVGDELYGHKDRRLCLHAESLEFIHPITGKKMHIRRKADF